MNLTMHYSVTFSSVFSAFVLISSLLNANRLISKCLSHSSDQYFPTSSTHLHLHKQSIMDDTSNVDEKSSEIFWIILKNGQEARGQLLWVSDDSLMLCVRSCFQSPSALSETLKSYAISELGSIRIVSYGSFWTGAWICFVGGFSFSYFGLPEIFGISDDHVGLDKEISSIILGVVVGALGGFLSSATEFVENIDVAKLREHDTEVMSLLKSHSYFKNGLPQDFLKP